MKPSHLSDEVEAKLETSSKGRRRPRAVPVPSPGERRTIVPTAPSTAPQRASVDQGGTRRPSGYSAHTPTASLAQESFPTMPVQDGRVCTRRLGLVQSQPHIRAGVRHQNSAR